MKKIHYIIMIPGLNDQFPLQKMAMRAAAGFWKRFGVIAHVVEPHWEEGKTFAPKLDIILDKIDQLVMNGNKVSVLGLSAGGSAALNAFTLRKNVLNGVVNGTGRLRAGANVRPSLEWASRNSPAFAKSVFLFENKNEKTLTAKDRKRILTLRPIWDEIVPSSTVAVPGADNRVIPVVSHLLSGAFVCLFYGKEIVKFLDKR